MMDSLYTRSWRLGSLFISRTMTRRLGADGAVFIIDVTKRRQLVGPVRHLDVDGLYSLTR